MNNALAFLPVLADRLHHWLGALLLPLAAALPAAVLLGLLFAARPRAKPGTEPGPQASEAPAAMPGAMPPTTPAATAPAALAALAVEKAQALAAATPVPAAVRGAAGEAPAAVLVVDDSAVVRAKLLKLLRGAGYDAVAARDGAEALDLLARRHFAVLVTDLEMPNMDGFELIAAVQGSLDTEDLPIIAITGHEALQARVHEFGGLYGIFRKPWNDRELLRRVQSLAALRRQAAAA